MNESMRDYEFVLTLSEGLGRLAPSPSPEGLGVVASTVMIPLEYETLNRILCPKCAAHEWESHIRRSIVGHEKLRWPYPTPGGDRHNCVCKACGFSITATFYFTT
jgi:hypothetical protein